MFNFKTILVLLVSVLLFGCSRQVNKPDISNVHVDFKLLRFEQDLFNADFEKLADSITFFRNKYGEFFDVFNFKIIRIGDYKNPAYPDLLKAFVTDYNINQVKQSVDSIFSNTSELEREIKELFSYYHYYFPENRIPLVVTYISGFNQSIITTDTLIGIGLDKYLGINNGFYSRLELPIYMRSNMAPHRIPFDCASAWAITQFPISDSSINMLSNLIYKGKIAYFVKSVIPDADDSLVMAMNHSQLEWCKANENQMWTYLIENKILFKSDFLTIKKFTEEAPFTKDFGRTSPGKAAIWCGYQIVSKYMERNKNVTLKSLMAENDFQKILHNSKYKP
jgi:hypothetical protein